MMKFVSDMKKDIHKKILKREITDCLDEFIEDFEKGIRYLTKSIKDKEDSVQGAWIASTNECISTHRLNIEKVKSWKKKLLPFIESL